MKKILLLILAIFITSCSFYNKNDLEKSGFNGNIKSFKTTQLQNDESMDSGVSVAAYDINGNFHGMSVYYEGELNFKI